MVRQIRAFLCLMDRFSLTIYYIVRCNCGYSINFYDSYIKLIAFEAPNIKLNYNKLIIIIIIKTFINLLYIYL